MAVDGVNPNLVLASQSHSSRLTCVQICTLWKTRSNIAGKNIFRTGSTRFFLLIFFFTCVSCLNLVSSYIHFFVYVIFMCVVILTLSSFDSLLYLDKFLFFYYCFLVFNFRLLNFSFRIWCKMRWTVNGAKKIK